MKIGAQRAQRSLFAQPNLYNYNLDFEFLSGYFSEQDWIEIKTRLCK